jgi:tRNA modification GTPase
MIVELKADIEVMIDFPDEDIPADLSGGYISKAEEILSAVSLLIQRCRTGEKASRGLNIAIAGKPNVGKSSLLNLIANSERAIVSDIPGTTRDLIRETVEINGLPVNIIDTAGINDSADGIEKIGVELSRKNIDSASAVLAVFDPVQGFGGADAEILRRIAGRRSICIINKTDTATEEQVSILEAAIGGGGGIIRMSAKTGEGFTALHERLASVLSREVPGYENSFAADARVIILLEKGSESARAVIQLLKEGAPAEITAFELQSVIDSLSGITGEITPDDVLGSIFSRFCIGK